ncbi:tetratricopeptide repeat protein [Clostridium sp. CS001]|uniref:tetratricopeptide repeat protein n=1 Tax=Clostridium sp. CS001 TaxID=2880648 RepID=UPI001CF1B9DD|nr:tetratricopeptide repeat protein [Clostridium sp. CS001]MCB2290143.1 tetratricopeptide repeat protein [Clostridium sp. CS001]
MPICPQCSSILEVVNNNIYECPNCGFMMRIDKFKSKYENNKKSWFIKICEDDELWFKPAFSEYPSIIAHEYYRIYCMLKEGHTYGAILQIKDLLEVLLKFPTLMAMSVIYNRKEKSIQEIELIALSFQKILGLGDWRNLTNIIYKENLINDSVILPILKSIRDIYFNQKIDIVKWRNETIGHGALKFDSDIEFQNEVINLIKIIKRHFNVCNHLYLKLNFCMEMSSSNIELRGIELAKNLSVDGMLYFEDEMSLNKIHPFILVDNGEIFFFDTYIEKKKKVSILNYINGIKKDIVNGNMIRYYHSLYKESIEILKSNGNIKIIEQNTESPEEESYLAESERVLNEIQHINDYKNPMYIEEWLRSRLLNTNKGIFLLQMERGMGKTTFSKALDENGYNKIEIDDFTVRSYYMNDSYLSDYGYFYTGLSDLFRTNSEGKVIIKEKNIKMLSGKPAEMKKKFGELLSDYRDKYKKYFGKDKLLLIIDGIDEMPNKDNDSILKIIPHDEELDEGIYILLTCRTDKELPPHILQSVKEYNIPEENQIVYDRFNAENIEILKEYIIEELKFQEEEKIQVILEKADYRFLYLSILKVIMQNSDDELLELLPKGAKIFEIFLKKLNLHLGDKYFKGFQQVLAIVAFADEPLTLKEIVYLYGDDRITFKVLSYLYQIQSLLKSERSYRGNLLSISHIELKDFIQEKLKTTIEQLVEGWIVKLSNYKFDENESINDGELYLISNILSYFDKGIDVDFSSILNENFCKILIDEGIKLDHSSFNEHNRKRYFKIYSELIKIQKLLSGEIDYFKTLYFEAFGNSKLGDSLFENIETEYEIAIEKYNMAINCRKEMFKIFSNITFEEFLEDEDTLENSNELLIYLIKEIAEEYVNIGRVYYRVSDYGKAEEYYDKAIKIYNRYIDDSDKHDNWMFSNVLLEISRVYCYTRKYDKALETAETTLEIQYKLLQEDKEFVSMIARTEECIGSIYYNMGKVDIALKNLNEALNRLEEVTGVNQSVNYSFIIHIATEIGTIYSMEKKFESSVPYFSKAIELCDNIENAGIVYEKMSCLNAHKGIGLAYLDLGMNYKAIKHLKKALYLSENDIILIKSSHYAYTINKCEIYMGLADSYYLIKNYRECLKYYLEYFMMVLEDWPKDHRISTHDLHVSFERICSAYLNLKNIKEARIQYERFEKIDNLLNCNKTDLTMNELRVILGDIENHEVIKERKQIESNFPYGYFIIDINTHAVRECINAVKPLESRYSDSKKTYSIKFDTKICSACKLKDCPSKKKKGIVKFSKKAWEKNNKVEA